MATQPDLGITNPYQLTQEQFDAAIALLEEQFTHGPQFWNGRTFAEQITAFAAGDIVIGTTWQFQVNSLAPRRRRSRRSSPPRARPAGRTPG